MSAPLSRRDANGIASKISVCDSRPLRFVSGQTVNRLPAYVTKPKARRLVTGVRDSVVLLIVGHVQCNSQGCHCSIELSVV